jgi:hypothetical protein
MKRFQYPYAILILLLLGFFSSFRSFSQLPSNDNCAGAVTLVSGNTLSSTSSTLQFATTSSIAGGCGGATTTNTYDAWFKFQAVNSTTTVTVNITGSRFSTNQPYLEVLNGTCASFTSLNCQATATSGLTRTTLTGLTVGTFYYVRLYTLVSPAASGANKWDFSIGVQHQPINDDCAGAITLTPNGTCVNTSGTLDLATANAATPVGCLGAGTYYDVWYKFTATATTNYTVTLNNLGANITNPRIQIFTGTCASLTSVSCATTTFLTQAVTNGTTYYVRIANATTNPSGTGSAGSFNICLSTSAAPSNDACSGAIALTSGTSCSKVFGTLLNANVGASSCGNAGSAEVWYSFVAQSAYPTIDLADYNFPNISGSTTPRINLYSGTCGSLTSLACTTDPLSVQTAIGGSGLTIGQTYYVQITTNKATGVQTSGAWGFSICVTDPSGGASVDFGKSYVNVTKGTNGGTIDVGDVLEIRATLVVSGSSYIDSVAYYDTLLNTKGFKLVSGSIALKTNEGKIYRYDSPTKTAFTDAFDSDPGWAKAVGSDTAIQINMGKFSSNVARGKISVSDAGPKNNGAIIIMATYQVQVYAPYYSKINYGGGKFTYKNPATGVYSTVDFVRDSLIVYNSPGLCPNSAAPTNIISDEYGGSFGTAASSVSGNRNRTTSPNTNYIYTSFSNNSPQDYYYGITNNTSGTTITAVNTWPKSDGALDYRVFDVWDITGDHTGAANTVKGNAPCDPSLPISSTNPCGYMLVVNSAYNTDTAFQYTVSGLCPNTYYEISAWFKNICYKCGQDSLGRGHWSGSSYIPTGPGDSSGVKPNIAFDIDGVDYYTTGNIQYQGLGGTQTGSDSLNNWVQRGFTYKTGTTQTGFVLTLRNNAPGGGGNDWAIDDIALKTCSPDITVTPGPNPFICDSNTVDIGATISSYFDTYVYYKWEKSTDNGATWTSTGISGGPVTPTYTGSAWTYAVTYPTFVAYASDSGSQYRVVVATTPSNLSSSSCSFSAGNRITLTVDPCDQILGLDILSFRGRNENNYGILQWTVSKEEEPLKYEIQKSKDGSTFETIGTIAGFKNPAAELNSYVFTDPEHLDNTLSWYRIKAIKTQSNKVKYSKVIQLIGNDAGLQIESLINPFKSQIKFDLISGVEGMVQVQVIDQYQHVLKTANFNLVKGTNKLSIPNTDNLPAGFYILKITSGVNVINKKIIKRN